MSNKPNARQVGWMHHSTQHLYSDPRFSVRRDAVTWPDGVDRPYTYIESGPAVIVVPFTPQGDVILIRQFRYTVDQWVWEVPAGGTHDFEGTNYATLVERELREEIGGTAEEIIDLGTSYLGVGITDKQFYCYAAFDVILGEAQPEPGELIKIHTLPFKQALHMAYDGTITGMPSAYALMRCLPLYKQRFT